MFVRASVPSPSSDPDAFAGMDVKDLAHLKLLDAELLRVIGDPLDAVMRSADVAGDIASTIGLGGLSLVPFGRFAYNMALRPVARRLAENAAARARGKQNVFAAATMVDAVLTVAEHDALDAEQLADLSEALPLLDGSRDGRIWAARAWERLAVDLVARGEDPGVPALRSGDLRRARRRCGMHASGRARRCRGDSAGVAVGSPRSEGLPQLGHHGGGSRRALRSAARRSFAADRRGARGAHQRGIVGGRDVGAGGAPDAVASRRAAPASRCPRAGALR